MAKEDAYLAGSYEVIVIGAGHAGAEAALAAARMGCRTLLLTLQLEAVALMPCNPSVGGPAKGNLVRELDVLGGAMGLITDRSQIQMRLINTSKGPAVQTLRAQADKKLYQRCMLSYLEAQPMLAIRQAEARALLMENGKVAGVRTETGAEFRAPAVLLASGTYLDAEIIIGEHIFRRGPSGFSGSYGLADQLRELGIHLRRFKTGTPARVDRRSLDFSRMQEQPGDAVRRWFSVLREETERPNIPCWLTYTNTETHRIIEENLHRAPLYTGQIRGVGPRYCPSIETKIVRFPDRDSHQVFLEPEGVDNSEYYVQGMSSSLPEDVQLLMLRSIAGLEQAEIIRPAYAIEYECLDSGQFRPDFAVKALPGFFTAGQINGSSGYEEAAAQGLLAGANAALYAKGEAPFLLSRAEAYMGVMADDLANKELTEPYRMFSSLAEYRLLLRFSNADLRLSERGRTVGLVDEVRWRRYNERLETLAQEKQRLQETTISPQQCEALAARLATEKSSAESRRYPLLTLLRRPNWHYAELTEWAGLSPIDDETALELEASVKYEGYIKKQLEQVAAAEKTERRPLSPDIDYLSIRGLSTEAAQKLDAVRPLSIGQASRIGGVSPADISVLLIYLEQKRREAKQT